MKRFFLFVLLFFLLISAINFNFNPIEKDDAQSLVNKNVSSSKIPSVDIKIDELTMESFVINYRIHEFNLINSMTVDIFIDNTKLATRFNFPASELLSPTGSFVVDNNNLGDVQIEGFQIQPSVEYKVVTTIHLNKTSSVFDVQEFMINPFVVNMDTFKIEDYTDDGFIFSLDIVNPDSLNGSLFLYESPDLFSTYFLNLEKSTKESSLFRVYGMETGENYTNLTIMIDDYEYGIINETISIPPDYPQHDNLFLFFGFFYFDYHFNDNLVSCCNYYAQES